MASFDQAMSVSVQHFGSFDLIPNQEQIVYRVIVYYKLTHITLSHMQTFSAILRACIHEASNYEKWMCL